MNEKDTTRRRDWQSMQQKIADAFIRLYRENLRQPTNAELANELNVSERTVARHLKTIDFGDYFAEQRYIFAPMMSNVMMSIYNSAIKGSPKAQKLMLQIVFGWAEPKTFEQPEPLQTDVSNDEYSELERGIDLLVELRVRERERANKYAKSG